MQETIMKVNYYTYMSKWELWSTAVIIERIMKHLQN